jgi:hypothetical protein
MADGHLNKMLSKSETYTGARIKFLFNKNPKFWKVCLHNTAKSKRDADFLIIVVS